MKLKKSRWVTNMEHYPVHHQIPSPNEFKELVADFNIIVNVWFHVFHYVEFDLDKLTDENKAIYLKALNNIQWLIPEFYRFKSIIKQYLPDKEYKQYLKSIAGLYPDCDHFETGMFKQVVYPKKNGEGVQV